MLSRCKKTPIKWAIVALTLILFAACSSINNNISTTTTINQSSSTTTNSSSILYKNTQYGFNFKLPKSWEGFSIISGNWEGNDVASGKVTEKGPLISIRHPQWTSKDPRQDIPIMIFTLDQWNLIQKGQFHIGAAPIGPSELGRNKTYVFALPARYNYAFPTGYEEVEDILKNHPLQGN
jgi:hypothetical protein